MSRKRGNYILRIFFSLNATFYSSYSIKVHIHIISSGRSTFFQWNLRATLPRLLPRTAQPIEEKKSRWCLLKSFLWPTSQEDVKDKRAQRGGGATCRRKAACGRQTPASGRSGALVTSLTWPPGRRCGHQSGYPPSFAAVGPWVVSDPLIVAPGPFRSVRGALSLPVEHCDGRGGTGAGRKRAGNGVGLREAGPSVYRDGGGKMAKGERAADGRKVGKADTPKVPIPLFLRTSSSLPSVHFGAGDGELGGAPLVRQWR